MVKSASEQIISVNMLLGNSIEPFLEYSLESVKWADELVVIDTAIGENINLAKIPPDAKVVKYEYNGLLDFSKARNLAIENSSGDFIWKVDSDEVYYNSAETIIRKILKMNNPANVYAVSFYHFMFDTATIQNIYPKEVILDKKMRWELPVHERIIRPYTAYMLPLHYCHFGYLRPKEDLFDRWVLYTSLEGNPDYYSTWNRNDLEHILDDRKNLVVPFLHPLPEVMRND